LVALSGLGYLRRKWQTQAWCKLILDAPCAMQRAGRRDVPGRARDAQPRRSGCCGMRMWMAQKERISPGAGTGRAVGHRWGIERHSHTRALQKKTVGNRIGRSRRQEAPEPGSIQPLPCCCWMESARGGSIQPIPKPERTALRDWQPPWHPLNPPAAGSLCEIRVDRQHPSPRLTSILHGHGHGHGALPGSKRYRGMALEASTCSASVDSLVLIGAPATCIKHQARRPGEGRTSMTPRITPFCLQTGEAQRFPLADGRCRIQWTARLVSRQSIKKTLIVSSVRERSSTPGQSADAVAETSFGKLDWR